MKRRGLLVVTLLTLLLTGVVLASAASPRSLDSSGILRSRNPFDGETAIRYRQCQPTHWRACLLQH
jgi:hypothetical protein